MPDTALRGGHTAINKIYVNRAYAPKSLIPENSIWAGKHRKTLISIHSRQYHSLVAEYN